MIFDIPAWLSWQAIRALMPKAPPWLGHALAAVAVVALIWGHGYWTGSEGKDAAVAERDLHWIKKLSEQHHEQQRASERARLAANRVSDTPADRAERLRLCRESPTCRDGRQ